MLPSCRPTDSVRAGVILLVVVALLTLFALVGLSFVLYADAHARAARVFREAETASRPDLEAEPLLAHFLNQLIYDASDDASGVQSGLRGHGLARSMYGWNDDPGATNNQAFNGVGRLHTSTGTFMNPFSRDDFELVNYTWFRSDGFLRDPERLGSRPSPNQPKDPAANPYLGGFNAPYTYPDLNNMYLAAVRADGAVLVPSFHRPRVFGPFDRSNPNWTSAEGKYLLLRPRPAEHAGFPYPEDEGGDVKNLVATPGYLADSRFHNNDSVWLDLGYPVCVAADGRRFKPLFAPLIVDLDNRINLNVHGNVRGRDSQGNVAHASNQGWGPWEINLGRVLASGAASGQEWPGLLLGTRAPAQLGRYGGAPWQGVAGTPGQAGALAPGPMSSAPFYAQIDFDGCDEKAGAQPSARLQLPGTALPLACFPTFGAGYGNASDAERRDHPALYNPLQPGPGRRSFPASNLEALLRYGDNGSPGLTSELLRLCPASLREARARNLVTTHSFDLSRPTGTAWIHDPALSGYGTASGTFPRGPALGFPQLSSRGGPPLAGSEFGPTWQSQIVAALGRINLNRRLPPYPIADRFDVPAVLDQFDEAQFERQRLTREIFDLFLKVTGTTPLLRPDNPADDELATRRFLAQLAVNIVDFIDEDDIFTPFNFHSDTDAYPSGRAEGQQPFDVGAMDPQFPGVPRYWVFGTELPRLVLNEVLAEYREPSPAAPGSTFRTNVWVELFNIMQTPAAGTRARDGVPIPLQVDAIPPGQTSSRSSNPGGYLPYQVVVADSLLADPVVGLPRSVRTVSAPEQGNAFPQPATQITGVPLPSPAVAAQGFMLLGPRDPAADDRGSIRARTAGGTVPDETPILRVEGMQYDVTMTSPTDRTPDDRAAGVTVALRRLANPHLPHNPNPAIGTTGDREANPFYNPYITIDYLDAVPVQNAAGGEYSSWGKAQPCVANRFAPGQLASQVSLGSGFQTVHTFGRANDPAPPSGRYDWLAHFDRPLVSPAELLHVSAFPPHRLTQQFISAEGTHTHRAPWFDEGCRLHRAFEFLEAGAGAAGPTSDRVPGRINLNTVWDPETLLAILDPQASNSFDEGWVRRVFDDLVRVRSPQGAPGSTDRPFRGQAAGVVPVGDLQYPDGLGIKDTLLRAQAEPDNSASPRLFENATAEHPVLRFEPLNKLFNQVTTRSNVFAVWLTVGFFEVVDDSTRPVRLGAEIGRSENRHVRHRMFAIVDRSVLAENPGPRPTFNPRSEPAVVYFSMIE